jgi:acyl-CoA thioester hydrolase
MSDDRFSVVQRVRWGDLDALQHMNNVEFLRFYETARIDYIRDLIPGHAPGDGGQFGFIFAEAHINFRAPAFLDDVIRTYVWAGELRRSAVRIDFEMVVEGDGRKVADGWGMLVGYDYDAGKAQPLPDAVRERVEQQLRDTVG